jgi:enamine deaminase RidA (YjgF/YER057c/UK114 family)
MATLTTTLTSSRPLPKVPGWLKPWIGPAVRVLPWEHDEDGVRTTGQVAHGRRFSHVRVRVHDAASLSDLELQHATTQAYREVRQAVDAGDTPHPVRFWNFIPGIGDPAGGGLDRYMVFNAGRYAAFSDWFCATDRNLLAPRIATATGIGHPGRDLMVHCLADRHPGRPVENPRQQAAYRYSEAYGPLPPCFARATVVDADNQHPRARVIIGGTSSIVGEASVHIGDVPQQTRETLDNIDALVRAAGARGLDALHHVRVYYVDEADAPAVLNAVRRRLPHLREPIDMIHAPLCRPDLGVEIEGLADI